jgi:nicotinate-nucleotide adenylyltransferase
VAAVPGGGAPPGAAPRREGPGLWRFPSGNTLICLNIPRLDIKAAEIRERWRARRSLALLVPPRVQEVLEAGGPEIENAWGPRL